MKLKIILICTVVAMSLSLFACTSREVSLEISCDDFMDNQHISKEVAVAVDGTVSITLCSNPSTGFSWSENAEISNPTVLEQTDHQFVSPEEEIPGAAGKEIWTFKALKEGTSTASLEYSRPWEGGEKGEWTFILIVNVK
jgi:inhibitor of cysteine peptidase